MYPSTVISKSEYHEVTPTCSALFLCSQSAVAARKIVTHELVDYIETTIEYRRFRQIASTWIPLPLKHMICSIVLLKTLLVKMTTFAKPFTSSSIVLTGCLSLLLSATSPITSSQDADAIRTLVEAYPEYLIPSKKQNILLWKDGTEMVFDDGTAKADYEDALNRASLKDQMSTPYSCRWCDGPPALNDSPGRMRNEAFFRKMYGDNPERVKANLVPVEWESGKVVWFTKINGAAEALKRVRHEINGLPNDIQCYVCRPLGTFSWRNIAGTGRISMHRFGAAIDFRLPEAVYRYWRWDVQFPEDVPTYPESILRDLKLSQIVSAFEEHGFIWGGKWHHYDTMHFEYRPELTGYSNHDSTLVKHTHHLPEISLSEYSFK